MYCPGGKLNGEYTSDVFVSTTFSNSTVKALLSEYELSMMYSWSAKAGAMEHNISKQIMRMTLVFMRITDIWMQYKIKSFLVAATRDTWTLQITARAF